MKNLCHPLSCLSPDPQGLYEHADVKPARRRGLRVIEDIGVYNNYGETVKPDDLPVALYPGQVVIANIELRLYVFLVVWRSYTVLTLAFHSFDIQGTRTYQLYWTEVTVLGTAWMDAIDVAERDDREAEKRKAASSPTASTPTSPAKRGPDVSIDLKPSPKRGPAVKSQR